MRVSAALLKRENACFGGVAQFRRLFGNRSVIVTEALCVQHALKFNWDWAAETLLSPANHRRFRAADAPRMSALLAKRAVIRARYDAEVAAANEAFTKERAASFGKLAAGAKPASPKRKAKRK